MDIYQYVTVALLAFARIGSFLFMVPFLSGRYIPVMGKLAILIPVSILAAEKMPPITITNTMQFAAMLIVQILIGLTMAYIVNVIFSAVRLAGSWIDMDMGYSSVQVFDPGGGQNVTIIANLFTIMFTIVFLSIGGINFLIEGIMYSFKFTTPGFFAAEDHFFEHVLQVIAYMFAAGIQIALPIVASMFILNVMMLMIGKSAPQMNIFANVFGIKIMVGFLLLYATLPFISEVFYMIHDVLLETIEDTIDHIFVR